LNANDKEIIEYLSNPLPNFYMCNEAISDMQGWVNGSLRSSNIALDKISEGAIQPLDCGICEKNTEDLDTVSTQELRVKTSIWG